ncbi:hypothetical protein [Labedaea rhizosphaerae]|uniref:Uncharacterized protein n=1 Tax=Labedaea rhizosphaerae TaxID=598644 RepID=A0A4R6RRZ3_LABRH|nr:hypothetical protein [Labedaea rhizosphaerae]TDP89603.1 hypothetical protein EV186_1123 [Labedaea rhizosphaerae]
MSRIRDVMLRYEAAAMARHHGVEILSVGDPAGAELNQAVHRVAFLMQENGADVWGGLFRAVNALRWRRLTQIQPGALNDAAREAADGTIREAGHLRRTVSDERLLDQVIAAAHWVLGADSPAGALLLESIEEVGAAGCIVIAGSRAAQAGMRPWLREHGVSVFTFGDLGLGSADIEQAYVVGPPRFFPSTLVTAPPTGQVSFVAPAWFRDRALPVSRLAVYAEGALRVQSHISPIGDMTEPVTSVAEADLHEDVYAPEPNWDRPEAPTREPSNDEVEASKILLGGGYAIWLDDGERIRTLDPRQPTGERVTYTPVDRVMPGTYLVLRVGATERHAMHDAALALIGKRAASTAATQAAWKDGLAARIQARGRSEVVSQLRALGVKSAHRAPAWTEPTLICPKNDHDLTLLLGWLDLQPEPSHGNAVRLRRALHRASAALREELETAAAKADLAALEADGHLRLDLEREGFRGMVVARVLAISPYTEIVARQKARVPFRDGGALWLE